MPLSILAFTAVEVKETEYPLVALFNANWLRMALFICASDTNAIILNHHLN